ncbi:MAG: helix-turn-helix domain-containing protein [Polyangiaceae bacterium]
MYQLRRPAARLSEFVEHYWFVDTPDRKPVSIRVDVFVDARADLVFNFGAPYLRTVIGGRHRTLRASNLDAQRLVPIRIEQRGLVRTTGVRFHLGGLAPWTTEALSRVTGRTVPPSRVFGREARALEAELERLEDIDTQAAALDAFFLRQMKLSPSVELFGRSLELARRTHGGASVARIAEATGVSRRHVERLFAQYLGLPPKTLSRVLRFQYALASLMGLPAGTLADVAASAGYFDQAHFVREFRRMTGGVPRGYRGYYPSDAPTDFAPNVVAFVQDASATVALGTGQKRSDRWRSADPAKARKKTPGGSRRRR